MSSRISKKPDEKLSKSTSQIVVDLILNNDDREDVASGKYNRLGNVLDLIDLERVLVHQTTQAEKTKPRKRPFFR